MLDPVPTADVIQLNPEKPTKAVKRADAKWGAKVMQHKYCIVPSLLLRAQNRLKLTAVQLAVLLQVCDFWWDEARKPFPSKQKLALRLGMTPRQVQRHLAALEDMKYIARVPRFDTGSGGRTSNTYDLAGLVAALQAIEPDFREAEKDAETSRRDVQRRNYRPAPARASA